jgi:adenylate kinase family enzyme
MMTMTFKALIMTSFLAIMCGAGLSTPIYAEEPKAEEKITFNDHVLPIFRQRCGSCHNSNDSKGGLSLDTYLGVMQGGASGEKPKAGEANDSYLLQVITHESEPTMPPKADKIPEKEIAMVRNWINQGLLETSSSKAKAKQKNNLGMAVITSGRPAGDPIFPQGISLDPTIQTPRAKAVTALATSPWAPLAAVSSHKQIILFDPKNGDPYGILPFPEGTAEVLKFSRNGSMLACGGGRGGDSGKVVLFDVKTGNRIAVVGSEYDSVLAADVSADQTRVVLGGPKRMVRVYDPGTGELVYEKKKHTDWVTAAEFSPDGVLVATGDRSSGLIIWEAQQGAEYLVLNGHKGAITSVSWRPDSNILASSSEDGEVKLWELNEGKNVKSWKAHDSTQSIQFTRDGKIVTTGRDRVCKLFDGEGKELKQYKTLTESGMEVAFDAEDQIVLAGDMNGQLFAFNAESTQQLYAIGTNYGPVNNLLERIRGEVKKSEGSVAGLQQRIDEKKKAVATRLTNFEQATKNVQQQETKIAGTLPALQKAQQELQTAKASEKAVMDKPESTPEEKAQVTADRGNREEQVKKLTAVSNEQTAVLNKLNEEKAKLEKVKQITPAEQKELDQLVNEQNVAKANLNAMMARLKNVESRIQPATAAK